MLVMEMVQVGKVAVKKKKKITVENMYDQFIVVSLFYFPEVFF